MAVTVEGGRRARRLWRAGRSRPARRRRPTPASPGRVRPPSRPWRRPWQHRTPSSPRCAQARAGTARTGRACPSAGVRPEPRDRTPRGPVPGATRPGRRRPRSVGRRRPARVGMLGGVGIHGQLMEVAHQLTMVQGKALHLAIQQPALRRSVPAQVPWQAAGGQLQPAARAGGRAAHGDQARASKQAVSRVWRQPRRVPPLELPRRHNARTSRPKLGTTP
jgi:hypothetical protein